MWSSKSRRRRAGGKDGCV